MPSVPTPFDAFLELLLRAIPGMAFVVRPGPHKHLEVVAANVEAAAALAANREGVLASSLDAIEGRGRAFGMTPLDGGRLLLVRAPASQMSAEERLRDLAHVTPRKWRFTRRQRDVALLMVHGVSNRDISDELGLRENTIELHVSAILRQTGADNRTQLVAWFWTEDVIGSHFRLLPAPELTVGRKALRVASPTSG